MRRDRAAPVMIAAGGGHVASTASSISRAPPPIASVASTRGEPSAPARSAGAVFSAEVPVCSLDGAPLEYFEHAPSSGAASIATSSSIGSAAAGWAASIWRRTPPSSDIDTPSRSPSGRSHRSGSTRSVSCARRSLARASVGAGGHRGHRRTGRGARWLSLLAGGGKCAERALRADALRLRRTDASPRRACATFCGQPADNLHDDASITPRAREGKLFMERACALTSVIANAPDTSLVIALRPPR